MSFKLGLAQCCHPEDGDVVSLVDRWAQRAADQNVDLLVFPEALMTPFEMDEEAFARAAEPLDGPFCTALTQIAARYHLWMVFTANEQNPAGKPFNTAVLLDNEGTRRGFYRKVHLFDTAAMRESDKTTAGNTLFTPVAAPFGTIGMAICYDLRFPEVARRAALADCDVMLYPAAWVDGPHKVEQWKTLLKARAIENEIFVAGLSRCDRDFGPQHQDYAGHSCIIDPLGTVLAEANYQETLLTATIDKQAIASARANMPIFDHRKPEAYR